MDLSRKVYRLKGQIQHYSWGGNEFIPGLLGEKNSESRPCAEYWLGAHPNFPAILESNLPLDSFIKEHPSVLGKASEKKFGSLPFLLKILDVKQMLSIQVHPGKREAEIGFEKENRMGIARNAPNRNYKDDNHKPELMVALSDFWLLHGFKHERGIEHILSTIPEFRFLLPVFQKGGYRELYETVMQFSQDKVNEILTPLVERILPLYESGRLAKSSEDFWAARAVQTFCKGKNYDRGIFSIYFFNLLHLKKGEGIFQPAGLPHAYLEGQNVELMANSDNVLRAGLTDKYIDIDELMKHTRFEATIPQIIHAEESDGRFEPPVDEFALHHYHLEGDVLEYISKSAEILLVTEGAAEVEAGGEPGIKIRKGEAVFVGADSSLKISGAGASVLFRAFVPDGRKN